MKGWRENFPFFLIKTNGIFKANAIGKPNKKPLLSIPAIKSIFSFLKTFFIFISFFMFMASCVGHAELMAFVT